jgi:hypothetical protein
MLRKLIPIFTAIAILLTACGGQAEPTMSAEEVQGTAVAAAWTMVAMTQEAIPTNTPIPPTETPEPTPIPTDTPEPLPTEEFIIPTATQASTTGGGECTGPVNMGQAGPKSNVRFQNQTGGSVQLSLFLNKNAHGQCGYITTTMSRNQSVTLSLPKGDYWVAALITQSDGKSRYVSGPMTNRQGDFHLFDVHIRNEGVFVK